jgi:hypothetical protein
VNSADQNKMAQICGLITDCTGRICRFSHCQQTKGKYMYICKVHIILTMSNSQTKPRGLQGAILDFSLFQKSMMNIVVKNTPRKYYTFIQNITRISYLTLTVKVTFELIKCQFCNNSTKAIRF